jgi:glucose-6-phosphate isomerase
VQKIGYDIRFLKQFVTDRKINSYAKDVIAAQAALAEKSGQGSDFLGWLDLPDRLTKKQLAPILEKAAEIRDNTEVIICIGIGGSYLGARAAIEYLSGCFEEQRKPRVIFAGHQVNSDYLTDLIELIDKKDVALNIISKSGTTTEPGIAFRVLRQYMEKRYGKQKAAKRIIATTDPKKGALRKLATSEGYSTFDIPADVGGRFSVLTPVGLFPIAVAGIDINALASGAREAMEFCSADSFEKNMAATYAVVRTILFREGKHQEVLAGFQPQLHYVSEWWKQLAGESEGKDQTGIFPAALDYTTDLHSLGQWMQEGMRNVFETFMFIKQARSKVAVPRFPDDSDDLNYLAGKSFEEVNENAFMGTILAHLDGGVPASVISLRDRTESTLGQLFYFFEKAIALSGYLNRVNPFDQPGVEAYKKNMFALFNKPGFEEMGKKLRERLAKLGV